MKKKVVPTLQQGVKAKIDMVTSDNIKIYYTGKFQDFTARYIINKTNKSVITKDVYLKLRISLCSLSKEQSILSREIIQNAFFSIIMPLFRLRHFIHYQAPYSRALAPAYASRLLESFAD